MHTMTMVLLAIIVYAAIFLADYMFYVKHGVSYRYVSRRTWCLFTVGQILILAIFFKPFGPFLQHIYVELGFLALLTILISLFTYILTKEQEPVCFISSRTEHCLNPEYVFVKGTEIVFQQLTYCAMALSLLSLLGNYWYTYIIFVFLLIAVHTVVVIGSDINIRKILTFGIAVIAAPCMYIFIEIGWFFPAVYLHSLMYVFYWLTFADFD